MLSSFSGQRRSWPLAEKRRIVELSLRKGVSVGAVAKQFRLDPPTLSSWRTLYRQGKLTESHPCEKPRAAATFLPVTVESPREEHSARLSVHIHFPSGITIQIEAESLPIAELGAFCGAFSS